jgi:hypothetical protein
MGRRSLRETGRAVAVGVGQPAVVSAVLAAVLASGVLAGGAIGTAATVGPEPNGHTVEQSTPDGGEFGFENESYRVVPPEVAEIGLTAPEGGVFSVFVEAPGDHFAIEATIGAPGSDSGGGQPTVKLDTGNLGADDPREFLSVANGTVHRVTVHEHDVGGGTLPGGEYQLRVVRGTERAAATLQVAPGVTVEFGSQLSRSALERDPVRTITGETDLEPGESLEVRVTSTGRNAFRMASEAVVTADGTYETTIDLGAVPAGSSFEVTVYHDGLPRARHAVELLGDLPEPVDGRQVGGGITFAYEGDQLTLEAAANQSVTGETAIEEGGVVTIVLRSPESHLHVVTTTVDSHGSFAVTADLAGLQPRTDVVVSAVGEGGASGAAPARIVAPEEASDRGDRNGATGERLLDDPAGSGPTSGGGQSLVRGIVALVFGAILSVVASGLLLGVDLSALSPQRE